jgi:hypothetical protein
MREVGVKAPAGKGAEVAGLAPRPGGVGRARVYREFVHGPDVENDVVSLEASTPDARRFVAAVLAAPFFEPGAYAPSVREPRAVVAPGDEHALARPFVEPGVDVTQDLFQLSHVTPGHVLRVAVASLLPAHGMRQGALLTMAGALLFLPVLPAALGLGLAERRSALARQGPLSLGVGAALVVAGGFVVGRLAGAPSAFHQFSRPPTSPLASADDVGRREMLGLAAASQFALAPAWLGLSLAVGFDEPAEITARLASPLLSGAVLVLAGALTYRALRPRAPAPKRG